MTITKCHVCQEECLSRRKIVFVFTLAACRADSLLGHRLTSPFLLLFSNICHSFAPAVATSSLSSSFLFNQLAEKHTLVLVRHGESTWNLENKFTGWYDCPLSPKGHEEVIEAGKLIKAEGIVANVAHTSLLKRAIRTLWHVLEQTDLMWIPVQKAWQLNERHYGALQVRILNFFGRRLSFSRLDSYESCHQAQIEILGE